MAEITASGLRASFTAPAHPSAACVETDPRAARLPFVRHAALLQCADRFYFQ